MLGVGATMTFAAWTDHEVATTTITSGTFAIESRTNMGGFVDSPQSPILTLPLGATGLFPGEKRAAWIQIRNKGTVAGIVMMDAVAVTGGGGGAPAGNSLNLQNVLKVGVAVSSTSDPIPTPVCATATATTSNATGINQVPSPVASAPLPVNGIVTFCVVVELPLTAGNDTQGGDVRPTWTFNATTPTS